jgi:hypothetical protein
MITAVVRVEHGVEALAVTLSALVPGVTYGLIGDAVVLTRTRDEAVAEIADVVGASLLSGSDVSWRAGAGLARRQWILCLEDGDIPREGWVRVLERFIALSPPERRFGRLLRRSGGLAGALARLPVLFGTRRIRAGDLVHRSLLEGGGARRPARVGAVIERDPVFG